MSKEIPDLVREYRKLIRCLYPWQALHVYPRENARIVMLLGEGHNRGLLYGSQNEKNLKTLESLVRWKREHQWNGK